jgi:hypothetical protein
VASRDGYRRRDLFGGLREAHGGGLAGGDTGVTPVEGELKRFGPDSLRAESDPEVSEERTVVDARSLVTVSVRSAHALRRTDARSESGVGQLR